MLLKDFGLHPTDMEEPGPWRAKGARERPKRLCRNKQMKTNDQNLVLSNECKVGVPGMWLAQPWEAHPSVSLAFPGSQRGGLPVSSLSGQNVGPEVGWVGGHLVQFHLKQAENPPISS